MTIPPLKGRPAGRAIERQIAAVKREIGQGEKYIHGLFFNRLFPNAAADMKRGDFAFTPSDLFGNGLGTGTPSLAFLDLKRRFLVTDEERFRQLPAEQARAFFPVVVLQSHSKRARFWISEEGQVIEFKGLTRNRSCKSRRRNINSGQPQGLFMADAARREVKGLEIIGALESGITDLGIYFEDLKGYVQIYRTAKPGWKYFPWIRMDAGLSAYEMLAELEGKSVERFLYEAGVRFGRQIRRLHKEENTLLSPFRNGTAANEAEFSSLHSANVDPFGNIIDLEGMMSFDEAEGAFKRQSGTVPEEMKGQPFSIFCRASDLQRFIGGRTNQKFNPEPHLFHRLVRQAKAPDKFFVAISGIFHGYYDMSDKMTRNRLVADLTKLVTRIEDSNKTHFSFEQTLIILAGIEAARPF